MKLIVAKNYDEMSAEAAKIMADVIKNKPDCVLGLATGSTPVGMYACLVMGCLLGFSKPREQKLIGFTIAIGCIFVYYITLPFFDVLAEKGVLHPLICAAFPPVAFLGAIIAFYKSKDL